MKKTKPTLTYRIRNSLYINVTNACTSKCVFCPRETEPLVKGYDLGLDKDPSAEKIINEIRDPKAYEEIVFCGFGEPTLRLKQICEVAKWVKSQGVRTRLNTNGQGDLIHKRSIVKELKGLFDELSISMNASSAEEYNRIMKPGWGKKTFKAALAFIQECKNLGLKFSLTAVDYPDFDRPAFEKFVTHELKCDYRIRSYNKLGDRE